MDTEAVVPVLDRGDPLTKGVIGAAIEVHKTLGPGLLESAYESCLCYELEARGLAYQAQVELPVVYRGHSVNCSYRLDLIIEDRLIVELKAVDKLLPIHDAQVLTYLRLSGKKTALLMNFNIPCLKDGIKRFSL
jgi:GxxExxY protein